MTAGVSAEGFTLKTLEEIKAEIDEYQVSNIDPALDLSSNNPLGQVNASHAAQLAQLWELAQVAYNGFNRDAAEGNLLDNIGGITGSIRDAAKNSTVLCTLNLDASKTIPAGSVANVAGQETNRWVLQADVTSTTAGNYPGTFASEEEGPFVANAGTLTVITAPVLGWNSVTNPGDAIPGKLADTDTTYRKVQKDELTAPGASTLDAIRADLLEVPNVKSVTVLENISLETDGNGLPGKSFECVVFDGLVPAVANSTLAQTIWNSKPGGMETYGLTTGTAIDSEGISQSVKFSRPTVREVYLELEITGDENFPSDGIAAVKAAVAARALEVLQLGKSVYSLDMKMGAKNVAGVVNVPVLRLGFSASPVGTADLSITPRQIAHVDTANILVNGV